MKMRACASATLLVLVIAMPARAETPASSTSADDGAIPIARFVAAVSKKTGKKFIVDPRVRADVMLIGEDITDVSYNDFLGILQVYGFTALESGGFVRVIPDAIIRQQPLPLATGREKHSDADYVSTVIAVKNLPAAHLVPLLRPLMPQQAHLAAVVCTNTLIMVDTYANVKRIEALVQAVDTGTPYKVPACLATDPAAMPALREPPPVPKEAPANRGG